MAVTTTDPAAPPDILGPTAPLPLATFVVGTLALAVMLSAFALLFRSGHGMFTFVRNELNFTLVHGVWVRGFVTGAKNTVLLAFGGELGGIVIGLILAMLILSDNRAVRAPARAYI